MEGLQTLKVKSKKRSHFMPCQHCGRDILVGSACLCLTAQEELRAKRTKRFILIKRGRKQT